MLQAISMAPRKAAAPSAESSAEVPYSSYQKTEAEHGRKLYCIASGTEPTGTRNLMGFQVSFSTPRATCMALPLTEATGESAVALVVELPSSCPQTPTGVGQSQ